MMPAKKNAPAMTATVTHVMSIWFLLIWAASGGFKYRTVAP